MSNSPENAGATPEHRSSSERTLESDDHDGGVRGTRPSEKQNEDAERGKREDQPKQPVGFFHPSLNAVRKEVILGWAKTTALLSAFVLCVLSLYWAVQFHSFQNLPSLLVYVVDMDSAIAPYNTGGPPLVGPAVVKAAQMELLSGRPHLGYAVVPSSQFDNDPAQVRQAVYDYDAWASIVVNPNATFLLRQAIAEGNASYDPTGAAQVSYVEARDDSTMTTYVEPMLSALQTQIQTSFAMQWTPTVLQAAANSTALANLQKVPQAVNPAIGFSIFNIRPFKPPVATPAITIGLIYLIIISFFSFSFYLPIHSKFLSPTAHPPLKFPHLIIWRWTASITAYFFLSLFYSLISLAFQIPFSYPPTSQTTTPPGSINANFTDGFGRGSFPVYWMLNWVGMTALGLACENAAMVVGQPWASLWLIFWVITNVSTSFYAIALSPRFYYWGYAWPLKNIVEGSRTVLFDVRNELGLNFGVLFAWAAVGTVIYPGCCWVMRWKGERGGWKRKKEKEGEKDE